MSDDATARLGLSYLAAGQMQKHVTLNEALTRLDALVQTVVISRSIVEQPDPAPDGALYLLPGGAEGDAWSDWPEGALVRRDGAGWRRVEVCDGLGVFVLDEGVALVRRDGAWTLLGAGLGEVQDVSRVGLAAEADAGNPFTARLNSALWTARGVDDGGSGDLRLVLNKAATGGVGSLVFQSAYIGRAELGLVGDDAFSLKVSADGDSWTMVLSADPETGAVNFPAGAGQVERTIITTSGAWSPPVWARWIEAVCIGGGGGGGEGGAGASGVARSGGGGGGAGGVSRAAWPVGLLALPLEIIVGDNGEAGEDGGPSRVLLGGVPILSADGGSAGAPGADGATAHGGAGGGGLTPGAAGGDAASAANGGESEWLAAVLAPGGGGAGGGLDAATATFAGGDGGYASPFGLAVSGGAGGVNAPGAVGDAPAETPLSPAAGGGGGGGASIGTGHAGGDGGGFGSGGGGGGAGTTAGGVGGGGGPGVVIITAVG